MTVKTAVVNSISLTSGGEGYVAGATVVGFTGGAGTGAEAIAIVTGGVTAIAITDGGTGYTVGDAIVITGDGEGATAEVATVDGVTGAITGITVTAPGTGYTSATAAMGEDATGEDAVLGAVTIVGEVTSVEVTEGGSGYTSAPTVAITSTPAASEAAVAVATIEFAWGRQFGFLDQSAVSGYTADEGKPEGAQHVGWVHGVDTGSGSVTGVDNLVGGTGYTEATVTIVGEGEGATAVAVIDGGAIDEIIITNGGRSYVQGSTTIVITGDGDDAAADAVVTNRVKRETIDAFGSITA